MVGDPGSVGTEGGGGELDAIGGDCPVLEVGGGVLIAGAGTAPDPLAGAGGGGGESWPEAGGDLGGVEDCGGEGGGDVGGGDGGEGGEEPELDGGAGGGEALGGVVVWEGAGGGGGELDGGGGLGGEVLELEGGEEADELGLGVGGDGGEAVGEGGPGGGATTTNEPPEPLEDGGEEESIGDGGEAGMEVMLDWVEVEFKEPDVAERDMDVLSSPQGFRRFLQPSFIKQIHLVPRRTHFLVPRRFWSRPRDDCSRVLLRRRLPLFLRRPCLRRRNAIPGLNKTSDQTRCSTAADVRTIRPHRRPSTREMVQKLSRRDQTEPAPCGAINVVGWREFWQEDRRKVRDPNP